MKKIFLKSGFIAIFLGGLTLVACKEQPKGRLSDPIPSGRVPLSNGAFIVYDDQVYPINTGFALIPGDTSSSGATPSGHQRLDVAIRNEGFITYQWNGADVGSTTVSAQHIFAGFIIIATNHVEDLPVAQGKDLTASNYTKVRFRIKGTLSSADYFVRVEGPDPDSDPYNLQPNTIEFDSFTLPSNWQEITIPVLNPATFSDVKVYLTVTIQFNQPNGTTAPGNGGTVYVDNIRYEQ